MSATIVTLPIPLGLKGSLPSNETGEAPRLYSGQAPGKDLQVSFHRTELSQILSLYGQMVSKGEWKDYAIDLLADRAVFSIYRRATETPLYTIEKRPALKDKQGAFSVIAPGGLILKRGHELAAVLRVFDKKRFSVAKG